MRACVRVEVIGYSLLSLVLFTLFLPCFSKSELVASMLSYACISHLSRGLVFDLVAFPCHDHLFLYDEKVTKQSTSVSRSVHGMSATNKTARSRSYVMKYTINGSALVYISYSLQNIA